ncbi:MAG TPA: SgcJ/EcaC family oxidoreductase [Blastocatellia bacterium]|nr:SgcJ/EcaC family oxidoreductase [Blastocatellia bacterium]
MPAQSPQEMYDIFKQFFDAKDADALLTLYEPDAAFVPQPGQMVKGHAAIREALGGFLALDADFQMQPGTVVETGDIALLISKWTLKGTDPAGAPVELAGQTSDVVRRQADGTWLFVIDNPYGM